MASPEGEVVGIDGSKLIIQRSNVVDQPEVFDRVEMGHGSRVKSQAGEGEDSSPLPVGDSCLDLRCPHQVGLVGGRGSVCIGNLHIVVGTSDLVLGAVAAAIGVSKSCKKD
jgi:hypothetical protein